MANKQVSYGSSGADVKKLQKILNNNGYNLDVDGIFGKNTKAAVTDFQKKNKLAMDGIVGVETWEVLDGLENLGGSSGETPKPTEPKSYSDIDLSKYDSGYQKSEDVIKAEGLKTEAENAVKNYGDFAYSDQATLDAIMDKILNREDFSYDLNGDALYQQYKDKYTQQGKMAMMDTMGQAAAMTGGYGNSYASTAGNQAYQAHLENLNDIVPELYQMAYDRYNQEGQDLYNQYGLLSDDRNMEYAMWGDKYNQLVADRDYYGNEANNAYAKDYGEWSDQRDYDTSQYWNETNFGYGQERDKIADEQWKAQFDEAQRQFNRQQALAEQQFKWQKSQASASSSGDSSGGSGGTGGSGGSGSGSGSGSGTTVSTSGVSSSIRKRAEGFESNTALAEYLDGLEATGQITPEEADALYAEYADGNEKYTTKDNDDGTKTTSISYKDMVGSTSGWTVVDTGGGNMFGIDSNAKVKSPNGETMTLANLKEKLMAEGMSSSQARNAIKALQQNLGISSNWFFGL